MATFASPRQTVEVGQLPRRWSLDDFDTAKKIGEGRFGKVYLAREKETKCAVVLKCLSKESLVKHDLQMQIQRECELQVYLKHRNVVRLLAFFWDTQRIFLVLEYCEGGDLFSLLKQQPSGRFESEAVVAGFVKDVASALQHCHSNGIMHRDVKPENIFLRKGRAKLGDFTWAVQCDVKEGERRQTLCGTLDYLSPEVVGSKGANFATDIWSLGCVLYELLVGKPPFEKPLPQDTCTCIKKGTYTVPGFVSNLAASLIHSVLAPDETQRYTATEVLNHPWILQHSPSPASPSSLGARYSTQSSSSPLRRSVGGTVKPPAALSPLHPVASLNTMVAGTPTPQKIRKHPSSAVSSSSGGASVSLAFGNNPGPAGASSSLFPPSLPVSRALEESMGEQHPEKGDLTSFTDYSPELSAISINPSAPTTNMMGTLVAGSEPRAQIPYLTEGAVPEVSDINCSDISMEHCGTRVFGQSNSTTGVCPDAEAPPPSVGVSTCTGTDFSESAVPPAASTPLGGNLSTSQLQDPEVTEVSLRAKGTTTTRTSCPVELDLTVPQLRDQLLEEGARDEVMENNKEDDVISQQPSPHLERPNEAFEDDEGSEAEAILEDKFLNASSILGLSYNPPGAGGGGTMSHRTSFLVTATGQDATVEFETLESVSASSISAASE